MAPRVAPPMRVLPLALAAAIFWGVTAILIYLSVLSSYGGAQLSEADLEALAALQGRFSKCVDANGLGLKAVSREDYFRVVIQFPSDTVSKWVVQRFQELFAQTKYKEAAEPAAESPQGLLRTPETVAKFQVNF